MARDVPLGLFALGLYGWLAVTIAGVLYWMGWPPDLVPLAGLIGALVVPVGLVVLFAMLATALFLVAVLAGAVVELWVTVRERLV